MAQRCDPSGLVELVRRGDVAALDAMTRCYGERLLAVGRRACRSEEEAEDAVQDALLAAGEHLTDFRADGSLEGWLVRMVANACSRMRRGRKNDPALHTTEAPLATRDPDPATAAERGELALALGNALLALSPQDRTILLLAEAEDWTAPEIATALQMTPGSVRTRLSRARARLREALPEWAGA